MVEYNREKLQSTNAHKGTVSTLFSSCTVNFLSTKENPEGRSTEATTQRRQKDSVLNLKEGSTNASRMSLCIAADTIDACVLTCSSAAKMRPTCETPFVVVIPDGLS